jgi:hypothetical protein
MFFSIQQLRSCKQLGITLVVFKKLISLKMRSPLAMYTYSRASCTYSYLNRVINLDMSRCTLETLIDI